MPAPSSPSVTRSSAGDTSSRHSLAEQSTARAEDGTQTRNPGTFFGYTPRVYVCPAGHMHTSRFDTYVLALMALANPQLWLMLTPAPGTDVGLDTEDSLDDRESLGTEQSRQEEDLAEEASDEEYEEDLGEEAADEEYEEDLGEEAADEEYEEDLGEEAAVEEYEEDLAEEAVDEEQKKQQEKQESEEEEEEWLRAFSI